MWSWPWRERALALHALRAMMQGGGGGGRRRQASALKRGCGPPARPREPCASCRRSLARPNAAAARIGALRGSVARLEAATLFRRPDRAANAKEEISGSPACGRAARREAGRAAASKGSPGAGPRLHSTAGV